MITDRDRIPTSPKLEVLLAHVDELHHVSDVTLVKDCPIERLKPTNVFRDGVHEIFKVDFVNAPVEMLRPFDAQVFEVQLHDGKVLKQKRRRHALAAREVESLELVAVEADVLRGFERQEFASTQIDLSNGVMALVQHLQH